MQDKKLLLPFAYDRKNEEEHVFRFLWRVVHYRRTADEKLFEVQPFYAHERKGDRKVISVLGWLFEYGKDKDSRWLRLFFSPKIFLD